MDFKDYRKKKDLSASERLSPAEYSNGGGRPQARRPSDFVEEMIRDAQRRGEFDNLAGMGKPLQFEKRTNEGDNNLAYHLLKNNDYLPPEMELAKQIDADIARAENKVERVRHHYRTLRSRTLSPFERQKRAYNASVEKAIHEYDEALRRVNSKILTLNIMAPSTMHRPLLDVSKRVAQFRNECPQYPL